MNELCCTLICSVILIFLIFGSIVWCYNKSDGFTNIQRLKENFSPTGWTRDCPHQDHIKSEDCGPGCYTTSKINKRGCRKISKPNLENLPLGWGGTLSIDGVDGFCVSNVNGVMKNSKRNPYGLMGEQMYGMCVMGSDNAFENIE